MYLVRAGGRNAFQVKAYGWDKKKIQQIDKSYESKFMIA